MKNKRYVITKKVAKHGSQAIIVIPRILEDKLKPGTIVELRVDVLEEAENENWCSIKLRTKQQEYQTFL